MPGTFLRFPEGRCQAPYLAGGKPALDLRHLGRLVASAPAADLEPRPRPQPRRREHWGWRFAGWMGPMYGPVPVGHLALGLIGLYFKLR